MKNSKISIIVPVYNVQKYLKKCLESLINQTYKNLEILLIDDGSKDDSGKICDEYAKKDNRIRVIHQKNSGVSKARNNGLDNFTGDYVMFIDSDDWIELNTCELLINEIESKKLDIVAFNIIREYGSYSEKNTEFNCINDYSKDFRYKIQAKILSSHYKIKDFTVNGIGYAVNKIINKNLIKNLRFKFEEKKAIYEDVLFYYYLFESAQKIGVLNEYLYHYRISVKTGFNNDVIEIMDEFYNAINDLEKNHKDDEHFKQSLYSRLILNLHKELIMNIYNENLKISYKERKKILKNELKKYHYKKAVKEIDLQNLNSYLKIYVILFKTKQYLLTYAFYKLEMVLRKKRLKNK